MQWGWLLRDTEPALSIVGYMAGIAGMNRFCPGPERNGGRRLEQFIALCVLLVAVGSRTQ